MAASKERNQAEEDRDKRDEGIMRRAKILIGLSTLIIILFLILIAYVYFVLSNGIAMPLGPRLVWSFLSTVPVVLALMVGYAT